MLVLVDFFSDKTIEKFPDYAYKLGYVKSPLFNTENSQPTQTKENKGEIEWVVNLNQVEISLHLVIN